METSLETSILCMESVKPFKLMYMVTFKSNDQYKMIIFLYLNYNMAIWEISQEYKQVRNLIENIDNSYEAVWLI